MQRNAMAGMTGARNIFLGEASDAAFPESEHVATLAVRGMRRGRQS